MGFVLAWQVVVNRFHIWRTCDCNDSAHEFRGFMENVILLWRQRTKDLLMRTLLVHVNLLTGIPEKLEEDTKGI